MRTKDEGRTTKDESSQLTMLERLGIGLLLLHKGSAERYGELDALRGIAIVMMVIYHLVYDLALLGYYGASVTRGAWAVFARTTASLFILLMGVSVALSHARADDRSNAWHVYKHYLARGLKLLGWGMVITLVTWVYFGQVVIVFGILHLIGVATILAFPFLSLRWANLTLGVAIIGLGIYLNRLPVSHPWLLLLGLRPPTLFQFDYFPLLPWFGVALLGVFVGGYMYPGGTRRFSLPGLGAWPVAKRLGWLGRRSLAIYLLHQPFLFAMFSLAGLAGIGR